MEIAVIDDDEQILTLMKATLFKQNYAVAIFSTSDEAYEYLKKRSTDIILCDISLETSTMERFFVL